MNNEEILPEQQIQIKFRQTIRNRQKYHKLGSIFYINPRSPPIILLHSHSHTLNFTNLSVQFSSSTLLPLNLLHFFTVLKWFSCLRRYLASVN
ncbi:hypothetical protein P8452_34242 [Trifolium repens]|nr:hypothetical protein P8452_34242 [Trifolium repens]